MGFDNECILNIQSLPGEYFCPVCRTLIYPNEALQTQCTHLYCKPCLAYIVATTQACPYDGYLVTETDSKPLMESNKSLAETIGKVMVHCLYHKSGCQWQGTLSDCITHCTSCAFGNSPVVCNRCGTQIIHRQVQEHAQFCPGLQPQAQVDSGQPQSSAATQAVAQDPSAVASVIPAAAPATTVVASTTITAATASASAAAGPAVATAAGTMATAPAPAAIPTPAGQGQAVTQTQTAEQWYQQQLQYQQYYQQQYPGYNPYTQQYQQYGQYQQAYQQYTQPPIQAAPQPVAQASVQSATYVQPQVQQPAQPQHMVLSQPQTQPHNPQFQAQAVQPQPQQHPPLQPAPQVPQMQAPQNQVQPQLTHPQAQPIAHPSAPTQAGGQPFGLPVTQLPQPLVQPPQPPQHQHVVAHQQHPQLQPSHQQPLPQQQLHSQPNMQVNSQIQHQHLQMQQQSYPQPQAYPQPQPRPHAQPQNPSVHVVTGHQSYPQPQPAHQMPQGAPLQRPAYMPHQRGVAPQQPAPMRPPQGQFPVQGQQPTMLPVQGTHANVQHTPQQQHHVGHHSQRLPGHASIPSQAPQQGFPPHHASVPLQTGQPYQQGMPSSQQQMHSQQPLQPHGLPYMQQHLPGHGFTGHNVHTAADRPMSHVAPQQQFQHPPSGPVKDLQANVMIQHPPVHRISDDMGVTSESQASGQHTGQVSLVHESHASQSGKLENATGSTEVSGRQSGDVESAGMKTIMSQCLGDQKMNGGSEQNEFDNVRKDATQASQAGAVGVESDNADASNKAKMKEEVDGPRGEEDNSHVPDVHRGKEPKTSDASGDLDRGSVHHAPQQNVGGPGSHGLQGMGSQQPPGPMPYYMQGQRTEVFPNQVRPPSKSFPENIRPPVQQLYSSYHSEMAARVPGQNQNQMLTPQPAGIRPGEGMIRPPMGGALPGLHDTRRPPFAPEHVGRPRPLGNTLEPEANTAGFFDGRQAEPPSIHSGMAKSNGIGAGPLGARALHEEGFNSAGEHLRSFAAYPGGHNVNRKDIEEDLKQFPRPPPLDGEGMQRGLRPFERALGRTDGFPDSLPGRPPFPHQPGPFPISFHEDFARKSNSAVGRPDFLSPGAEFGHHRIDGMPPLRSPGPFYQGMAGGPGGLRKEQLGSGNLPGNVHHDFDGPEFPHTRFHPNDSFGPRNLHSGAWDGGEPLGHGQLHGIESSGYRFSGHMHPNDPSLVDYSRHGFPKESGHFGSGGPPRKREIGWCRICRFNCGSAEDLDMHVQTREHQQMAMDIVLKMKQDVAKRQKMSSGGPKSFNNKKVVGKGSFGARGNRR